MKEDFKNTFLNSDEFAEEILYVPVTGASRTINAIVDRRRVTPAGEDTGRILLGQVEIIISTDATEGVATIQKGIDKFSLPEVLGGISINWGIADILVHDEAMWHILLQK